MVYPVSHLLLRAHGVFGTAAIDQSEFWSFGLRLSIGAANHTEAKKVALLSALQNAFADFHSSSLTRAHGYSWITKLTAAYIGTDGKYEGGESQPTTEQPMAVPLKGAGSPNQPWSNAMAVTLRTDIDRGPGSKGRFYVPSGLQPGAGGQWNASEVNDARANAVTLIDAVNDAAEVQWPGSSGVSVISNTRLGYMGHVIDISVGRAPDTQRRRDNRVREDHSFAAVPTSLRFRERVEAREYGGE